MTEAVDSLGGVWWGGGGGRVFHYTIANGKMKFIISRNLNKVKRVHGSGHSAG